MKLDQRNNNLGYYGRITRGQSLKTYVGHIMQNNRPTWDPLPGFGQTRLKNARKTWSREMQRDEASGRKGLR